MALIVLVLLVPIVFVVLATVAIVRVTLWAVGLVFATALVLANMATRPAR